MMGGCLPDQPAFEGQPGKIIGNLKNSRYIRDNCFFIGVHPKINMEHIKLLEKKLEVFFHGK